MGETTSRSVSLYSGYLIRVWRVYRAFGGRYIVTNFESSASLQECIIWLPAKNCISWFPFLSRVLVQSNSEDDATAIESSAAASIALHAMSDVLVSQAILSPLQRPNTRCKRTHIHHLIIGKHSRRTVLTALHRTRPGDTFGCILPLLILLHKQQATTRLRCSRPTKANPSTHRNCTWLLQITLSFIVA